VKKLADRVADILQEVTTLCSDADVAHKELAARFDTERRKLASASNNCLRQAFDLDSAVYRRAAEACRLAENEVETTRLQIIASNRRLEELALICGSLTTTGNLLKKQQK